MRIFPAMLECVVREKCTPFLLSTRHNNIARACECPRRHAAQHPQHDGHIGMGARRVPLHVRRAVARARVTVVKYTSSLNRAQASE